MVYIVANSKYARELIKLGFSDTLCATPQDCEDWLHHCQEYNMKFLKGSYGTIVHEKFDKYFKTSKNSRIRKKIKGENLVLSEDETFSLHLDHTNLLRSKIDKDVYILTSSPYSHLNSIIFEDIKNYPYEVYVINPNFLDYYAFIDNPPELRHPLDGVNYAFTNASDSQMESINKAIYDDTGLVILRKLLINWGNNL